MEINQQSILKAFYLFDKAKMFLPEQPNQDRISQRKNMAQEWLDAFCTLPAEVWEDAVALAIKRGKHWPSVDEMWSYIGDATEKPEEATAPPPPPTATKQTPKLSSSEKLRRMIELAKQGKFSEAKMTVSIAPEIDQDKYIQEHWPDAVERIKKNCQDELTQILRQETICLHCPGIKKCRTHGFRTIGYIEPVTGSLYVRMVPCKERRSENDGRRNG